jgi:perosamine synthetase
MIPLAIPNLSGNEARYLQQCIDSSFVSSVGPFVTKFEEMISEISGSNKTTATSSGTTGLHSALTAVGVKYNDLVILPSFTFIGSANSISHCGAVPWLFDVNPITWTLNVNQLHDALKSKTIRTKEGLIHKESGKRVSAIMPVYVLGIPAEMDEICRIAKDFSLPIVADAACALGMTYKKKKIGEMGADLSVFSFNGNKTVTSGGGGAVSGSSIELVQSVYHLTTTARVGSDYDFDRVGFNYRLTNIQAAVGCAQLERLEEFVQSKRNIQKQYNDALLQIEGISPFPDPAYGESSCWFSGVQVNSKIHKPVSEIRKELRANEIDARPFWKPIHLQKPYEHSPKESLDFTDNLWMDILTLPCSTSLSQSDQSKVILAVKNILS